MTAILQLLEKVFSVRAVPRSYKEEKWGNQASSVLQYVKKSVSWKGAAIQIGLESGS